VPRRTLLAAGSVGALVAIVIALAAGGGGELSDVWDKFKEPDVAGGNEARLVSAGGSGRWQFWGAAVDEFQSKPLLGTGPGTYEYFWAREGSIAGFIRDGHSLYLEVLGEAGPIGLLLVLGLVGGTVVIGVGRTRAALGVDRELLAAATASCAAFAVGAGFDWLWELAVLAAVFLLLAGTLAAAPGRSKANFGGGGELRIVLGAAAVLSIVAILIPLAEVRSVRASEEAVHDGDLSTALEKARDAAKIEPYAATPRLQEALVLERSGQLDQAISAATEATEKESTNWRTWLVLSRLEAKTGEAQRSVESYRKARSLNPRSPLFQSAAPQ
jgi:hypothetical protein